MASKMESLTNQLANQSLEENQEENQSYSPSFQHWDDILETIHRSSIYRLLSSGIQVEFQLIIYHSHPTEETPLVLKVRVPALHVSTAGAVLSLLESSFRNEVWHIIQTDILSAPFYFICQEEEGESYDVVIAKHSTKLVGQWFERNVRLGSKKFFKMALEMKGYEGEADWVDEGMTLRKLAKMAEPVKSKVTGE